MSHRIHTVAALAAAMLAAACADHTPLSPPIAADAVTAAPEGLARQFAKALKNPAFRAYIKAQLDASPYREHKLDVKAFLGAAGGRALRQIAAENGKAPADVAAEAQRGVALEVYFPVPAHRASWRQR